MPEATEKTTEQEQDIVSLIKEYATTRLELTRLSAIDRITCVIANLATDGFVVVALLLTFLFGSVTLGFYLGELLDSNAGGFGIVSLIYLFLALAMYFVKDRFVEKRLIDFMVKRIFRNKS